MSKLTFTDVASRVVTVKKASRRSANQQKMLPARPSDKNDISSTPQRGPSIKQSAKLHLRTFGAMVNNVVTQRGKPSISRSMPLTLENFRERVFNARQPERKPEQKLSGSVAHTSANSKLENSSVRNRNTENIDTHFKEFRQPIVQSRKEGKVEIDTTMLPYTPPNPIPFADVRKRSEMNSKGAGPFSEVEDTSMPSSSQPSKSDFTDVRNRAEMNSKGAGPFSEVGDTRMPPYVRPSSPVFVSVEKRSAMMASDD
jgi:hypothetical protein